MKFSITFTFAAMTLMSSGTDARIGGGQRELHGHNYGHEPVADYPTPFGYGLDAGGCNNTNNFRYCETLAGCIPSNETCLEMAPLDHSSEEASSDVYCGPMNTGDPHVFGPSVWKFLHTISMYYDPNGNAADVHQCESFIDAFGPMIPCMHCAWHYNQFLWGSKIPSDMRLNKTNDDWDWGENEDNSPCTSKANLQQFFVEAHNNVGQHVQLDRTKTSGVTRPTFTVNDLEGLYGNVFDPLQNKYVSSQEPEIFHPILLEAINLLAMNYATLLYFNHTYDPLDSIKFACTNFLNTLPFMINHPHLVIHDTTTACKSRSALLDWVKDFEREISNDKLAILSLKDRKKRYETRNICKHNGDWVLFPMRRAKELCPTDSSGNKPCQFKVCNATEHSNEPHICVQPWVPALLKNVPTP